MKLKVVNKLNIKFNNQKRKNGIYKKNRKLKNIKKDVFSI